MIIGNPYKFAILIERIEEWETDLWKNGIMFVIMNGELYPKEVRTTTYNSELPNILNSDSAFVKPYVNIDLYKNDDSEILAYFQNDNKEEYYHYFIPFHEIEDSGYRFFVVSNGCYIKILIGKFDKEKLILIDKIELSIQDYEEIKLQIIDFYNAL